jgi:dihydroflavonol-4-reductase
MNVFLTGGTGFIGQALVARILMRGWSLKVLVRDPEAAAARWIENEGATLVQGDVATPAVLTAALKESDVLIHNAGVYELGASPATVARMNNVNVEGTDAMLGAAYVAGVPRVVYVSSVWALGPSGYAPSPSVPKDEAWNDDGPYLTAYHRSKAEAHKVALDWRRMGLPLIAAMPNAVVGPNDHSTFGYFLRLMMLGGMSPMAWGDDAVYGLVEVNTLAEGLCLAAQKGTIGEDYLFCGPSISMGELFSLWGRKTRRAAPRWYLPRGFMRPQMAMMEPIQRMMGLPAFLSRDTVDTSRAHLDYSSLKAQRELGWTHPDRESIWDPIIQTERELMSARNSLLNKLRHKPVGASPSLIGSQKLWAPC